MEAAIKNDRHSSVLSLKEVMETFFSNNTPDKVKYLFWKLFQCYVTKDCNEKAEVPNEEVALFYDQLIDLVNAVYVVYQGDRASLTENGGSSNV